MIRSLEASDSKGRMREVLAEVLASQMIHSCDLLPDHLTPLLAQTLRHSSDRLARLECQFQLRIQPTSDERINT